MPFKSEAQRRFMWSQHPEIAKRWTKKYGSTPVASGDRREAIQRRMNRGRSNGQRIQK